MIEPDQPNEKVGWRVKRTYPIRTCMEDAPAIGNTRLLFTWLSSQHTRKACQLVRCFNPWLRKVEEVRQKSNAGGRK